MTDYIVYKDTDLASLNKVQLYVKRRTANSEQFNCIILYAYIKLFLLNSNINGRDVQRKNVVNNVDKSSLWAP